jgi:UDP-N-acetylmuramoyl-L-alanyl-D-glutamate--2,6-diaminopimelate ligase
MKLFELLEGVEYSTLLDTGEEVGKVTSNSREVQKGDVFVCIKGTAADGHKYAPAAKEAGAAFIIAEEDTGLPNQIIIKDTRSAYAIMCANYFGNPAKKLKLIGITGTNGKTTVAFLIKHIMETCGHKLGLIGTIKNMVGEEEIEAKLTTPDAFSLQQLFSKMLAAGCDYCVMEVSSHALEQERVKDLHFKTAVFTNLTQDHLDFHGTMENYFAAKQKLFDMCDTAVINGDDEWGERLIQNASSAVLSYGLNGSREFLAKNISFQPSRAEFSLQHGAEAIPAVIPIPGKFSLYNALAAIGAAVTSGISAQEAAQALATAKGVKGRAEVFDTRRSFSVIIDYAHTPDGLVNIISAMREVSKGRIVTLFGCGGDRDPKKRPLMGAAAAELSDYLVVTSDNPRTENAADIIKDILPGVESFKTPYTVIENRREAIEYAVKNAKKDDVIILAGKGHETYQILNTGTIHFDEREVLAEVLQ